MKMPWINLCVQSTAPEYIQMKRMIYYILHTLPQMGSLHIISATVENNNKICFYQENLISATGTSPFPTFDVTNKNVQDYALSISHKCNLNTYFIDAFFYVIKLISFLFFPFPPGHINPIYHSVIQNLW